MDTSKFNRLKSVIQNATIVRNVHSERLSSLEEKKKNHTYKSELRQKESEIFKRWLDDMLKQNVSPLETLSTSALRHVIYDQKLSLKMIQEPKYNKISTRFSVEEETEDGTISGDPVASFGGGAAVLISLVMRVVVMSKMKTMGNLILLDESLVAIAKAYVPHAAAFIRQLSEQTGIHILMVTHNSEYLKYSHIAYEGCKVNDSLQLKELPPYIEE